MKLTQAHIDTVRGYLKGSRLDKFEASILVLQESLADGAWTLRGSVKAQSGFYQGLCSVAEPKVEVCSTEWYCLAGTLSTLRYGGAPRFMVSSERNHEYVGMSDEAKIAHGLKVLKDAGELAKVPDEVLTAWIALAIEKAAAFALLDAARPKAVITAVGLSPKVTKTLTEMNLDIELPSIAMAKIERRERMVWSEKKQAEAKEYYHVVAWTPGIVHGASRFQDGCQACGKNIPSGMFVPVEAKDKKSGNLVSLWLGCDCARNIFGVKDIGVEKA